MVATIRLPEALAERVYESTVIAEAGFSVRLAFPKGAPDSTPWQSLRVRCPRRMTEREVVSALRALLTTRGKVSCGSVIS